MEILKDVSQIAEKLKKIFGFEINVDVNAFIKSVLSEKEIEFLSQNIKETTKENSTIDSFADLIFQLKDYIPALSNFVKLLLIAKEYDLVFLFVKKIFIGQIGQIKYTSNKLSYNFLERYFDRFIEIVKNCNIDKSLYLPLILKAFESEKPDLLFSWKRPAIEFMQKFFNANEEWTLNYINSNLENKYKLLEMITDFNTARGIKMLIDDFIIEKDFDEEQNSHILKKYKRETFLELDKRLVETIDDNIKEKLAYVFLSFGKDNEALTRLQDIYNKSTNENLRTIIAERLEIIESPEVKSEKQFLYTARRRIKEPQERVLGLPFDRFELKLKSGYPADNVVKTHLINVFKEEKNLSNLKNLNYLINVFNSDDLNNLSAKLFNILLQREDIKSAKWAVRFISLFHSPTLLEEIITFVNLLFSKNREKEGIYLVECLINCGIIETLKSFEYIQPSEKISMEWKNSLLQILSKKSNVSLETLYDQLAVGKTSKKDISKQTRRLFDGFINNRTYSNHDFEILVNAEPFASLFSKLIWGEYKNGKLYNAFLLKNGLRDYKVKLLDEDIKNFDVSIIHSLDINDNFEKITNLIERPLFTQFKSKKFETSDFQQQITEISNFNGIFIKVVEFIEMLTKANFIINKNENENVFNSLIHINKKINVACIVEFTAPITLSQTYTNLGNVYFVKFTDLIKDKNKYLFSKSDAISVPNLPARYFDYCMTAIFVSSQ